MDMLRWKPSPTSGESNNRLLSSTVIISCLILLTCIWFVYLSAIIEQNHQQLSRRSFAICSTPDHDQSECDREQNRQQFKHIDEQLYRFWPVLSNTRGFRTSCARRGRHPSGVDLPQGGGGISFALRSHGLIFIDNTPRKGYPVCFCFFYDVSFLFTDLPTGDSQNLLQCQPILVRPHHFNRTAPFESVGYHSPTGRRGRY